MLQSGPTLSVATCRSSEALRARRWGRAAELAGFLQEHADRELVQPSPLRSDSHAAFSQHTEHRRFADSHALSHIKARQPGHVEILDLSAVPIGDPVLRRTRRTLARTAGTKMERNRGVALQLGEGYYR